MNTETDGVDHELIRAAAHVAATRCRGDNHTMAAAARARDGRIVTAVNAYHFTGGPCAELVLIGTAAAQGAYDLDTIVAVGDRDRGVVPPCGRCRQVLLDYFPALKVIVGAGDGLRMVPVTGLLPESYVWADHQLDTEASAPLSGRAREAEVAETTVGEVMAELAKLEDPKTRAVNEKHGDDHGVNLGELRALAKRLKTQQELACRLWETRETAARLLAILICRPKAFGRDELDAMVREARAPKVHDWLVNYVVKKNSHSEELRLAWTADPDPVVASAGWALTTERVKKKPDGLDLAGLLDVIEAEMKDAPDRLQWAMNHCLAQIGIEHAEHRARAIAIGERLEVLKDYPTSPGCTSPFAPTWITEMVRRQHNK